MRAVLLLALFGFVLLATVSANPIDIDDAEDPEQDEIEAQLKQNDEAESDEESDDDQSEDDDTAEDDEEGSQDDEDNNDEDDDDDDDESEPKTQN
ncbi:hypothetical protein KR018_011533 [Drosophila ironensis]|nr:hypothetical protein KR018_011533 [Drosophila ironensis]